MLKIDKSFVRGSAKGDERDSAVVRAIIGLARDLGLAPWRRESRPRADRERVAAWGCEQGQGFWLARPMAADAVTELAQGATRWARRGSRVAG